MNIKLKRVYDPPEADDGQRILVDGLWPRGLSREKAKLDEWMKDLAPSRELRQWFGHRPERWEEFRRRYLKELDRNRDELVRLQERAGQGPVTLLFAARDADHNNAVVVREWLTSRTHS